MKLVFLAVLGLSSLTFAGQENAGLGPSFYNPGQIYEALNVEAVAMNPGIAGVGHFRKSVGGLACDKSTVIYPNAQPSYSCVVDETAEDFKAIYQALKVKGKLVNPGIAGRFRVVKSIGGLTCVKSQIVDHRAKVTYGCDIVKD